MSNTITLNWKEFSVKLQKVKDYFKINLSDNYDGLVCSEENLIIVFKEEYSQSDFDLVEDYWTNITEEDFLPTQEEILTQQIEASRQFGVDLLNKASIDSIALGIIEAPNLLDIMRYSLRLQSFLNLGSLYAAVAEIDTKIAEGIPIEYAPYITEEILLSYKTKIQEFLGQ